MQQRLRQACASVHSQFSIDGSGMSSITAFMVNGLILFLTTQTTTWEKAILYISLYKQTNLANLLSSLTQWFAWLFKVITSTVTCKCWILTTRQHMTEVLLKFMVNISLDGRFLAVSLPEASLFNVCNKENPC